MVYSSPNLCHGHRAFSRATRRDVLCAGTLGLLGISMPEVLAARENANPPHLPSFGQARSCILLFMWGGPAHQDTWDMKPDAPAEIRGEFKPIATRTPGVHICEHFPQLAQRTDRLCIVRSMTHGNVDHTASTHFLLTGQPPPPTTELRLQWPHIGSVLSKLGRARGPLPAHISFRPKLPGTVPRFVEQSQGQFAGWLGPVHDPLTIDADPSLADYRVGDFSLSGGISADRLRQRERLLADLERQIAAAPSADAKAANYRRAVELLTSKTGGGAAFDLAQEPRRLRERYGLNPHGQSVLQARRLVERGVPLVTVFWPNDGIKDVSVYWDTHSRNFIDLKDRLMPVADQAFSALLDDLASRGLLDETLVIWTGEFGRTPKVGQRNSDAGAGADGRDHWPGCFTTILAGGGARGGMVYGASDRHAAYPSRDAVAPADLIATVYHALGVPREQVLHDTQDRPHFVRPGTAIEDLLL
jgi:hypothetical protein